MTAQTPYKTLPIPKDLYIPITYAIYEAIWNAIDKDDPKAKDMVEWYVETIGFSAYSLVEKLKEKGIEVKLPS
ncbi:MAG: hypothetical protein L5655_11375 [Thermosediminibacteraceae bacterium]|uniref:Uncharacterized protein n=1 Tax=Fervidicola ferrireducens TaxID=520764 RepID=A0A140L9X2_9FIRM|nr:hypothetical protein [Fervidicola ferrireducens]KXG77347.1 hypothetical protein AN618_12460 [Fervidicola ferrireducens]MCG0276729.1 hypothetical protein [Thermosediminibacteraceae bacterium]